MESQPLAPPPTILYVAVLLLDVYVVPSIQVYVLHAAWTSIPELGLPTLKFRVIVLSHPWGVTVQLL